MAVLQWACWQPRRPDANSRMRQMFQRANAPRPCSQERSVVRCRNTDLLQLAFAAACISSFSVYCYAEDSSKRRDSTSFFAKLCQHCAVKRTTNVQFRYHEGHPKENLQPFVKMFSTLLLLHLFKTLILILSHLFETPQDISMRPLKIKHSVQIVNLVFRHELSASWPALQKKVEVC